MEEGAFASCTGSRRQGVCVVVCVRVCVCVVVVVCVCVCVVVCLCVCGGVGVGVWLWVVGAGGAAHPRALVTPRVLLVSVARIRSLRLA